MENLRYSKTFIDVEEVNESSAVRRAYSAPPVNLSLRIQLVNVGDFSDLTVLEAACGRVASRNFLFELIMKKGTESPSATLSSEVVLLFIGETWRDNDQFAFERGG